MVWEVPGEGARIQRKKGRGKLLEKQPTCPQKQPPNRKTKAKTTGGTNKPEPHQKKRKKLHLEHHTTQPATKQHQQTKLTQGKTQPTAAANKEQKQSVYICLYICYMTTLVPLYFYIMHSNSGIVVTKNWSLPLHSN
jgi:FtsZ-interacting cell division protein ZipA